MHNITTVNGRVFKYLQSVELARLVYLRFGEDPFAAHAAWKRLLQNNCDIESYEKLVHHPEHTNSCKGWCLDCKG